MLGTSFAAAAVAQAGSLDMVRISGSATVTPSVAYLDDAAGLLTGEAADVLFHLLVLLGEKGVPLADVLAELDRREGVSGLEEKASRSR